MMVRMALIWLLAGVIFGGARLSDGLWPGEWRPWFSPSHAHMLFVGWFLQVAVGVAYWLVPCRRAAAWPLGYRESTAFAAAVGLNLSLISGDRRRGQELNRGALLRYLNDLPQACPNG
jgi:hypothetical protein